MLKVAFAYNYDKTDRVSTALFFSQTYFDLFLGKMKFNNESFIKIGAFLKRINKRGKYEKLEEFIPF